MNLLGAISEKERIKIILRNNIKSRETFTNFNNSMSVKKAQSQRHLRSFSVEHFGKLGPIRAMILLNGLQKAMLISLLHIEKERGLGNTQKEDIKTIGDMREFIKRL
ncbi:hypothetical protein [Flavobacterium sp. N502540]|uniref:hypothetical protein n=1 Tax=Flavobacterium sp. N502540 TaxID=2986838 RepID=UPI002224AA5D|nr:hypothetical protein [Flavobacterium sp. N502540]